MDLKLSIGVETSTVDAKMSVICGKREGTANRMAAPARRTALNDMVLVIWVYLWGSQWMVIQFLESKLRVGLHVHRNPNRNG